MRFFNTEGPVVLEEHDCIPPLDRFDLGDILKLIRRKKYFVLHAPRQTGKRSTPLALADRLNSSGEYRCLYLNVEVGQAAREDIGAAIREVLSEMACRARTRLKDDSVYTIRGAIREIVGPGFVLKEMVHLEQARFGSPSRPGYHNKQWAALMRRVGLVPSHTGEAGGRETGQRMSHYIAPGETFEAAAGALVGDGYELSWASASPRLSGPAGGRRPGARKTAYTCPGCGIKAWGKPSLRLGCLDCDGRALGPNDG